MFFNFFFSPPQPPRQVKGGVNNITPIQNLQPGRRQTHVHILEQLLHIDCPSVGRVSVGIDTAIIILFFPYVFVFIVRSSSTASILSSKIAWPGACSCISDCAPALDLNFDSCASAFVAGKHRGQTPEIMIRLRSMSNCSIRGMFRLMLKIGFHHSLCL
jgi:hypothetical protein